MATPFLLRDSCPQFSSGQSLSHVRLFATPWITAHQAFLSIINSRSLPKPMSIESVISSSHLILCHPLPLLPLILPSIRVFSNESTLHIRWPKHFLLLIEAENIKRRWQEYTEELYKNDLHNPDNHNGMITHLEPDVLECEVKWALESITTNKTSGGDVIPVELFQILQDDAEKVLHSICQQIWKTQQWLQDWKRSVFITIPKNAQTTAQSHSSHTLVK